MAERSYKSPKGIYFYKVLEELNTGNKGRFFKILFITIDLKSYL